MTAIVIPNGWRPRDYQLKGWAALEQGCKRAVFVWHRRAGKDSMSANWTATQAMQRIGLYWHMAPTQRQVRKIVWDGIDREGRRVVHQIFPPALHKRVNDQEMKIELVNGSLWQCVGSDNFDSLVGANPVGVVFSEWSLADPRAWDFVRPILAENGGWAIFIYTPRGKNHGKTLLDMARAEPGWFAQVLTVADTKAVPLAVIEQERKELVQQIGEIDADVLIQQEWYCSFDASMQGAYYAKEMAAARESKRIGAVPHNPGVPVNTFWDLGWNDHNAIVFHQMVALENRFLRSFQAVGEALHYYAAKLQEFGSKYGYTYGTHYLPHDAMNKSLQTGKSALEILQDLLPGHRFEVVPRVERVLNGIQQCRAAFPSCYFDTVACHDLLMALDNYRKRWNESIKNYTDEPLHDQYSNLADAFRQFGQGFDGARVHIHAAEPEWKKKLRTHHASTRVRNPRTA